MGLFSILGLGIAQMMQSMYAAQKGLEQRSNVNLLNGELFRSLGVSSGDSNSATFKSTCRNTFGSVNPVDGTSVIVPSGDTIVRNLDNTADTYSKAVSYYNQTIKISSIALRDFMPDAANGYIGTARVEIEYQKAGQSIGVNIFKRDFMVMVSLLKPGDTFMGALVSAADDRKIRTCSSLAGGGTAIELWQAVSGTNDIFYPFKVGVGTSVPNTKFNVSADNSVKTPMAGEGFQFHGGDPYFGTVSSDNQSLGFGVSGAAGSLTSLSGPWVGSISDDRFHIRTNNVERLVVTRVGNVGISRDSPRGALDVNGAVRIRAGAPTDDMATAGIAFEDNGDTGLFMTNYSSSATGDLQIFSNAISRITVLSSGRVGVNKTDPAVQFHVVGTGEVMRVENSSGVFAIEPPGIFSSATSTGIAQPLSFSSSSTTFSVGGSNRLTLDGSGFNSIVGGTSINGGLSVQNFNTTDLSGALNVAGVSTFSQVVNVNNRSSFTGNMSVVGEITTSSPGNIIAGGEVVANSDRRLKTEIRPLPNALEKVLMLKPVVYKLKRNKTNDFIGFVAQDVEELFPELVRTAPNGIKSVNYMAMTAPIVKSVQDLHENMDEEIKLLKIENQKLRNQIDELRRTVESL